MNFPWGRKKNFVEKWDSNRNNPNPSIPAWGYILIMFIFFAGLVKVMEWSIMISLKLIEWMI